MSQGPDIEWVIGEVTELQRQMSELPDHEQLPFFKGYLNKYADPQQRTAVTALWDALRVRPLNVARPARTQVVILLHGIRTEAEWQGRIAQALRKLPNTEVFPIGYGWIDAVRFLSPRWMGFRSQPEERILRELRDVQVERLGSELVVVAHSFSTYLMSRILADKTDIRVSKLILCGSIIPLDYRWDQVKVGRDGMTIVNEVGTRDVWPVLARVSSWGYGASGTLGFKTFRVRDRYFDYQHSDFFKPEHVEKFWATFIHSGEIVPSPWEKERLQTPWLVSVAAGVPYVKTVALLCLFALAVVGSGVLWLVWRALSWLLHGSQALLG